MLSLDSSLTKRLEEVYKEIDNLRQAKSLLENQLKEYHEELTTTRESLKHEKEESRVLKEAYENLKDESTIAQKKCVVSCNEKVYQLHEELRDCRMKISSLELLNEEVSKMNERLMLAEQENISNATLIKQLREEAVTYQRLNDSLKEKIRNMNSSDGKDFLDTFEEVMRSEFMTMKSAFEAKLRAAREESDALSKKHMTEIARMRQINPPITYLQHKSLSETSSQK